jgi:hypothetical protein
MSKPAIWLAACVVTALLTRGMSAVAQSGSENIASDQPGKALAAGWSQLKEGEAVGTVEIDAKRPSDPETNFLHISVTKTAQPGQGRVGAINSVPIEIHEGNWYDATFRAIAEGRSVGMVFSLEGADGKVLARTTLPEVGRIGRGSRGNESVESGASGRKYTVALHARASDPRAHLVVIPIEPTNVWLTQLTLTPRAAVP